MALPNFIIIGDVKAGTTSLYHYLRQHPEAYLPALKELRYFACDEDSPYHLQCNAYPVKTLPEYLTHFENSGYAKAIGEASPSYLRSPVAARRMKAALPQAKIIACLRNPADRLYSEYMMDYREGRTKKSFEEELFYREAALIKARFYWLDLKRYFDLYPVSQIKIFLFDDLKANAKGVVKELYRFLGIDETFAPDLAVQNEGGAPRSRFVYSLIAKSRQAVSRLGTPPTVLKKLSRSIDRAALQKTHIDGGVRRTILEICQDDIARTQELIGRDLSAWLR